MQQTIDFDHVFKSNTSLYCHFLRVYLFELCFRVISLVSHKIITFCCKIIAVVKSWIGLTGPLRSQWTDSVCFLCACQRLAWHCCTTWFSPCFSLCPPPSRCLCCHSDLPSPPSVSTLWPLPPPPVSAVWFAGIFHHVVPSVSSHQFGATQPTSGGRSSLLSLSSSSSTSSQTQQHISLQAASTRQASVSSPLPLSLSQAQHSRIQSVLHSPSPPALSLPPPPPLHSTPSSSSTPMHYDALPSSRSDLHSPRPSHSSLHHQRAQSSLSLSVSSSTSASSASVSAATAIASLASTSCLSTSSSSSRPFAVHYSPRLPPPPPPSSTGGGGSMWRTQGMHGTNTSSQLPGSRPR